MFGPGDVADDDVGGDHGANELSSRRQSPLEPEGLFTASLELAEKVFH